MNVQNRIYMKFEIEHQIDSYISFHKRRINGCTSIASTIVQASSLWLVKCRIDNCASVDSTVTIVESTVILIIFKKVLRFLDVPSV